jgi:hypothetical protein
MLLLRWRPERASRNYVSGALFGSAAILLVATSGCKGREQDSTGTLGSVQIPPNISASVAAPFVSSSARASGAIEAGTAADVGATASVDAGRDAHADTGDAAGSGAPTGPMLVWMRSEVATALAQNDYATLSAAFTRLAGVQPKDMANWGSIARDGVDASKRADLNALRAVCRGCHEQYAAAYGTNFRARPF